MKKLNEFLISFATALLLCALLTVGVVNAPPEPPNEGELEDTKIVGDWNWQVEAYVWGHWAWVPGYGYKFTSWISKGSRHATYGVFLEDNLLYEWWYDNNFFNETDPGVIIWHYEYILCNHIHGRAYSNFSNWLGQHWGYWTNETNIII